jgi:pantoate--beta-alanine ligase
MGTLNASDPGASPEVVTTIAATRTRLDAARAAGARVGIVPTMGYLHDGHLSLVEAAAADNDVVAVSIFVNPLQFGANEDLASYPRDLERDVELCRRGGAHLVFAPPVEEMYPQPIRTSVSVAGVSAPLEGERRPGHFAGVATVVAKLFAIFGPGRAYFGEKDWQQLAVIRRMAADLSFPIEVVGCPTVREPDGLAMSSRNVYLSPDERRRAAAVSACLREAIALIEAGERDAAVVRGSMVDTLAAAADDVDYAEVVDAATLEQVDPLQGTLRLLVAARYGRARLIDNMGVSVAG